MAAAIRAELARYLPADADTPGGMAADDPLPDWALPVPGADEGEKPSIEPEAADGGDFEPGELPERGI